MKPEKLIPGTVDYRQLLCYRKAETVYDITRFFCSKFLKRGDRTIDQMVQAARSGKQNIVEGTAVGGTSLEMEIKLVNVAKASLHELLMDYEDYLRVGGFPIWQKGSVEMEAVRRQSRRQDETAYWMQVIETRPDYTIANIAACLIRQADYLLHRHLENLSKKFLEEGGMRERMTRMRVNERNKRY